jgi:pimeloyl-ACP methyl ester carboxylesterase
MTMAFSEPFTVASVPRGRNRSRPLPFIYGVSNPTHSRFPATPEQLQQFAEQQRKTTSAECAYRYFETTRNLDVSELLPRVSVPTLVMHKREDQMQPFEASLELAAGIPGARFVALPGQNHIPL